MNTEGRTIYHAGDLNWWHWEGEPSQYNNNMAANFKREIGKLAGVTIDAAFLPLDPRLEKAYAVGFVHVLETARVKNAFPMHMWEAYSVIRKLKQEGRVQAGGTKIMEIAGTGQEWTI